MSFARPRYSMSQHGQGSTDNFGSLVFRPGAGNRRSPSWDKTETVVRILPCLSPDRQTWEPFRNSMAPRDFGDWMRVYAAVRAFGEQNAVTMLLYNPIDEPAYDVHQNPCVMLYDAINQAIRNKQEQPGWASLTKGGAGRGPALSRPTDLYLVRAGIFRIKNEDKATSDKSPLGLSAGEPAMFLEMTESAGRALVDMLEERDPDYQFPADGSVDYNQAYRAGDIVSIDKGAFVHFYQEGFDPREMQQTQASGPRQVVVGGNRGAGGGRAGEPAKRYACFYSHEWKGFSPQFDIPEVEETIRKKDRPWDDTIMGPGTGVLNFMDHATQARVLQERDSFPADVFLYGWRDHKEWIIQRTKDRAAGRVSVGVPEGQAQNLPQRNPVAPATLPALGGPAPAPAAAPVAAKQTGKVGGWGNKAWEGAEGDVNAAATTTTDPATPTVDADSGEVHAETAVAVAEPVAANEKEAAAMKAMEDARRRASRPSVPSRPQL